MTLAAEESRQEPEAYIRRAQRGDSNWETVRHSVFNSGLPRCSVPMRNVLSLPLRGKPHPACLLESLLRRRSQSWAVYDVISVYVQEEVFGSCDHDGGISYAHGVSRH